MQPALDVQNISKSYHGGPPVVQNLSFAIDQGEIFGLLGPNGAGKSTTINLITGVSRVEKGTIEVFGYDNQRQYLATRRCIGVMHQELVADTFFTIAKSLSLHPGYYGFRLDRKWRDELIHRLALEPHLHKPMNKLSGGLKRRFMVAKALIHKPQLLILDEPTAGVDVELRLALWQMVREINAAGTTVLLTTHYLEEAESLCQRVAIMNNGQLVALDSTRNLVESLQRRRLVLHLHDHLHELPTELQNHQPQLSDDGRCLTLLLEQGQSSGDILGIVCRLGLPVQEIETQRAGLEDAFIQLTGIESS